MHSFIAAKFTLQMAAQLVEQGAGSAKVVGSSPAGTVDATNDVC